MSEDCIRATKARLWAFQDHGARVGQADQDALGISRRDRENVGEALIRAERTPALVAVDALLKAKWLQLLEPYLNDEQQEELRADLSRAIMGGAA